MAWSGGQITQRVDCVLADNPSPMTQEGTNTLIVAEPGEHYCFVVDPGPITSIHPFQVMMHCAERLQTVVAIICTHRHADHIEGAQELSGLVAAPILSRDEGNLPDGVLDLGILMPQVSIVSLPGHSDDSVGILLPEEKTLITGDVLFSEVSTVVYYPEGNVGDHLRTLNTLEKLVCDGAVTRFIPAHGAPIDDPLPVITHARDHRMERLEQIKEAIRAVGCNPDAICAHVYGDVDEHIMFAAYRSVLAQLAYLAEIQDPLVADLDQGLLDPARVEKEHPAP